MQQYHAWLQAQAQLRMQRRNNNTSTSITTSTSSDSSSNTGGSSYQAVNNSNDDGDEDVFERVCLMETSVLLQSEELERAKVIFLQVIRFIIICGANN